MTLSPSYLQLVGQRSERVSLALKRAAREPPLTFSINYAPTEPFVISTEDRQRHALKVPPQIVFLRPSEASLELGTLGDTLGYFAIGVSRCLRHGQSRIRG